MALSDQVEADLASLEIEVDRATGTDRFATAAELGVRAFSTGPPGGALLVEGQTANAWASGFAAASAAESAGIVLANGDLLPDPSVFLVLGIGTLCGPNVSAEACRKAGIAGSVVQGSPDASTRVAALAGGEEVPGPGANATGDALLRTTSDPRSFCYEYFAYGLDEPVAAAHIHEGSAGVAGDVVVPLSTYVTPFGFTLGCAFDGAAALVTAIFEEPRGFYVNLHTASFPDGGFAFVFGAADDPAQLCYYYSFGLGEALVAAHIHEGGDYYVNLHTASFPDGAIRGQLGNF